MKKLTGVIITVLFLAGCGQSEPVELKMPYNVETARESCITEAKVVEPLEKVAEPAEESRNYDVAPAVIATITPTPTPTPEPTPDPAIVADANIITAEPIPEPEPEPVVEYIEPASEPVEVIEELPTPADEFAYRDMVPLGGYTITWYSRDMVGYDAPGASGNGLTPFYSCAMPDYGLLNCTIYVENYGFFHVDDISPGGICDLYVGSVSEIPAYGQDYQMVYIVG